MVTMSRRFSFLYLFLIPLLFAGCSSEQKEQPSSARQVIISIAPYRPFIKRLLNDEVEVNLVVPAGANTHSYEPTPRQVGIVSSADVWFRIGEEFEEPMLNALKSQRDDLAVVDLREGIDLLGDPSDPDPHIWLSPRRISQQLERIASELAERYPEMSEVIETNKAELLEELDILDIRLATIIDFAEIRTIMVAHPAYTYFCADYDLKQLSIERHGSEPGAHAVTDVIEQARREKIRRIFVQPQHTSKGATLIARTLDAEIIDLDPLDENYFDNMRKIAWKFAGY